MQNVMKVNDVFAQQTSELLLRKGIRLFNLIGSPGAGKTSVLEVLIPKLKVKIKQKFDVLTQNSCE